MNLDEHSLKKEQKIHFSNRSSGYVTGVNEVISFDTNEILLETEQGALMIKGSDLHITKLTVDKGEVEINGQIDSMIYSNVNSSKNSGTLFQRLFK